MAEESAAPTMTVEEEDEATKAATAAGEKAEEKKTVAAMKKFMTETKAEGNKSVWTMTLETFGMADGSKKKGDIVCETFGEAMTILQEMVSLQKEEKWEFPCTPLLELDSTKDDLLKSFLQWARKEDGYNVSKAYRRLEAYVDWMEQHREELLKEPMTPSSLKAAADAWKFSMTYSKNDELVWWFDIGMIDINHVKKELALVNSLRYFVWASHVVALDKKAQQKGMIMMEGLNKIGMMEMFTFMPPDLSAKLDRLTIGILPIRMTACYILGAGTWMHILLNFMKPFMSKKMRRRIIPLKKKDDPLEIIDKAVGRDYIPKGFAGLDGTVEQDILKEKYFS